jgi:hypothetical protein
MAGKFFCRSITPESAPGLVLIEVGPDVRAATNGDLGFQNVTFTKTGESNGNSFGLAFS